MYTIVFLGLTVVVALTHLLLGKRPRTAKRIVGIFLLYLLVINIGLTGLFAFYGHTFMADEVARNIGWAPGSHFQFEVAVANLAFGVLGVLCIWLRGNFWLATGLGKSVFLFGAAFGHIRDAMANKNFAPYNVGPVLFIGDIFIPILILSLLLANKLLAKRAA